MRLTTAVFFAVLGMNLISCGSAPKTFLMEDEELREMFRADAYASLTDYDRYLMAEYLMSKGNVENARRVYEDIATYNPQATAIKFKLATIYLGMDSVSFTTKDEKDNPVTYKKNGAELGDALLHEILAENPKYLPVYSQLMIIAAEKQDSHAVSELYTAARMLDKGFNTADYRVGYLTMNSVSDESPFEHAKAYMVKAQKSYRDLYDSYKNLANIQRVQKQDSVAYKTFIKALDNRSEAIDLFSTYYELADVCRKIYKSHQDEKYMTMALKYSCLSLQHFPGYQPAMDLVRSLTSVSVTVDSGVDSSAAMQEAMDGFCATVVPEEERVVVVPAVESVIPKSDLRKETMVAAAETAPGEKSGSKTKWIIGGAIVAGAGGVVLVLGGGGSSGTSGTERPPDFPSVP